MDELSKISEKNRLKYQRKMEQLPQIIDTVKAKLEKAGCVITLEAPIEFGWKLTISTGAVVAIYHTGKVTVQGKPDERVSKIFNR
jgi:hypothetical protein